MWHMEYHSMSHRTVASGVGGEGGEDANRKGGTS
jgi:hypothetical protein